MSDSQEQLPPKREINGDEFYKIISGQLKGHQNYSSFYSGQYQRNGLVFYNCKITEGIQIDGISFSSLFFDNCEFKEIGFYKTDISLLVFTTCLTGIIEMHGIKCRDIRIQKKSIINDIYINNLSEISSFNVTTLSNVGLIQFDDSKCEKLQCIRASTTAGFELFNTNINQIVISHNSSAKHILFNTTKIKTLKIEYKSYSGKLQLLNSEINDISIIDSIINDLFSFEVKGKSVNITSSQTGKITLLDSTFQLVAVANESISEALFITSSEIEIINISKNVFVKNLQIEHIQKDCKQLILEGCSIHTFSINIDFPYEVTIKPDENFNSKENAILPSIAYFDLETTIFPKGAFLHLSQVGIFNLSFDSFINEGRIVLNGVYPIQSYPEIKSLNEEKYSIIRVTPKDFNSAIDILNSDLGNIQLIGCNLAGFNDFEFKNSKMLGAFIAGSTLPTKDNIIEDKQELDQFRLALSQFKKIYENQGDIVRAGEYHSHEMDIYKMQLSFTEKPGTFLIIWLSSITSDFGQNIWKPLASLLTVHYWLFMLALGLGTVEIHKTSEIIYYYFYLANPIHQYVFKNDWTIIIDMSMRIWSSYMIYNFVRASRRFIK